MSGIVLPLQRDVFSPALCACSKCPDVDANGFIQLKKKQNKRKQSLFTLPYFSPLQLGVAYCALFSRGSALLVVSLSRFLIPIHKTRANLIHHFKAKVDAPRIQLTVGRDKGG